MTLFRFTLILLVGIMLYRGLLYMIGIAVTNRLRRRKRPDAFPISKKAILRIYLIALTGTILTGVIIIKLYVRGIL